MQLKALPGTFYKAGRLSSVELSVKAKERLRVIEIWLELQARGMSGMEASRVLQAPRSKLYRWKERLQRDGPWGLEDASRAPRRRRQPTWSVHLVQAVLELREQYPRWGKDKLAVLLRRQGFRVSVSMVGRVLTQLKRRGLLREPPRRTVSARKRRPKRPYALRKPREYEVRFPGDLVQVDTLDLRPLPGVVLKQFTARDIVSRWDVVEVYSAATATAGAQFLQAMRARFPFPVKAVQVDGGSEFMSHFEQQCRADGLRQFLLPPRSPKLNGHVERAQRTHTEEFWECYDGDLDIASARRALRHWERLYNTFRPHQALRGLTPQEYLAKCHPEMAPT